MRRNLWTALGLAAIGALLLISYSAGRFADGRADRSESLTARELIYLPTPATARLMSFGFQQLVADWYWVRGIQYFVEPAQELNQYRNLGDFMEVVVGVDPDFKYAYKFAGISIPYDVGRLHFANTDRAIDFLERGVARWPDDWQMRLYLGFYLLNFRNDPTAAAEQFAKAAPAPRRPAVLSRFRRQAASRSAARWTGPRLFTEHMLATTDDPDGAGTAQEASPRRSSWRAACARWRSRPGGSATEQGRWPIGLGELAAATRAPEASARRPAGERHGDRAQPQAAHRLRTSEGRTDPGSQMSDAIELRELKKSFRLDLKVGRRQALNSLSLTVKPGEIYGFLGPNGAGKTTSIKILVSLLRAGRRHRDHLRCRSFAERDPDAHRLPARVTRSSTTS